ncbi:MAG: DNA mismatch repair endonuclease MutL [Kangiellaceae bacterium]|nr:DNA mismatch repair endonuclease MutL [Kangiellaceae bacterium]
METESSPQVRIKQLDNRLANQIAAGEVVERPASVVKELLENSVDAGANRIEVDIERGGTRLMRITDNGCGIVKDDLNLALSRHATSKISRTQDLAAIDSLGFRGEALASIASVSRLTLTSRTIDSDFAWQAIAEGRNMSVKIQPASSTKGTRIEVRELFYNTPARQKFLRAEKTEFAHIEEIFKRHALANQQTAFILKHNHKVIKRIPATHTSQNSLARIEAVCGKPFAQCAVAFSCQHEVVSLQGWTGGIGYHRSESDIQYVFVNGRPVKDKMLNHAIRQSFQDRLPPGRMPTYVMFIEIDPSKIDVNVHPTKHEIRFDEQRMVHDLIVRSISESLLESDGLALPSVQTETVSKEKNPSSTPSNYQYSVNSSRSSVTGVGYSQASYQIAAKTGQFSPISVTTNESIAGNLASSESIDAQAVSTRIFSNGQSLIRENVNVQDVNEQNDVLSNIIDLGGDSFALIDGAGIHLFPAKLIINDFFESESWSRLVNNSKPLLFPTSVDIDTATIEQFEVVEALEYFGFVFSPQTDHAILLKQLPLWTESLGIQQVSALFVALADSMATIAQSEKFSATKVKISTTVLVNCCSDVLFEYAKEIFNWIVSSNHYSISEHNKSKRLTSEMAGQILQ